MNEIQRSVGRQGLIRPQGSRVLGGVCSGLGRRFGLSPWVSRILFVVILMLIPGSQLLIYPVLWFLMPSEDAMPLPGPGAEGTDGTDGTDGQWSPPTR